MLRVLMFAIAIGAVPYRTIAQSSFFITNVQFNNPTLTAPTGSTATITFSEPYDPQAGSHVVTVDPLGSPIGVGSGCGTQGGAVIPQGASSITVGPYGPCNDLLSGSYTIEFYLDTDTTHEIGVGVTLQPAVYSGSITPTTLALGQVATATLTRNAPDPQAYSVDMNLGNCSDIPTLNAIAMEWGPGGTGFDELFLSPTTGQLTFFAASSYLAGDITCRVDIYEFPGLGQANLLPSNPHGILFSAQVTFQASRTNLDLGPASPRSGCEGVCGKPINLSNGDTWIQADDYELPGLGGGISIRRTWNSQWSNNSPWILAGMFGDSWQSGYEKFIQVLAGGNQIRYWRGDGSAWLFTQSKNNWTLTYPVDERATLTFSNKSGYTLTLRDGSQETYTTTGSLASLSDRNGNHSTLTYDASTRITKVTDAAGRVLQFNYDPVLTKQVDSIQDATGVLATYTYDSGSHLTSVTYADNSILHYSYDVNGLLLSVTDQQGKVLEAHTYDTLRRGLSSQQANGVDALSVNYGSSEAEGVTLTDSKGNNTLYVVGQQIGNRRYVTSIQGTGCDSCLGRNNQTFSYDGSGNRTTAVDPNGNQTSFQYDASGNVTQVSRIVNGVAQNLNFTYNTFGEVLTSTDPLGKTTTYTYDSKGNLLTMKTPLGNTTTYSYDSKGEVLTVKDPRSNVTTFTYTSVGLLASAKDAQSNLTQFQYDAHGNRTAVIDALNHTTSFVYDSRNRVTSVTYPTSPATSVQFGYDYRGRKTSVTDANGEMTSYVYDDADRLTSVVDANSHMTAYVFDTENNLTQLKDAANNATSFQYDALGRVTQVTFPSNLTETYAYDSNGNLTGQTDRNQQTVSFAYDSANRLTSKSYPDSTMVSYTYDLANHLTQVVDPTGTYGFTFDADGRLTQASTTYSFILGKTFNVGYGYDAASNRTSMADPQNGGTSYGYDSLNRLMSLTSPQGAFGFSYDALSRRTQMTRPNGVSSNYSYDPVSRLLSVLHQVAGSTIDGAVYTIDAAGSVISKANQLSGVTSNYGYDPVYQLQNAFQGGATTESYSYDVIGNRVTSFTVPSYSYNTSNELTSSTVAAYSYDSNGNTLTKTDSTGTTAFTWDFENRLASVTPAGSGAVTFKYDPLGRRIQKSTSAATTNYVYDGANILEEVDGSGNVLARYTQGGGVDEPLAMLRAGMTSFYEADGLGSITSLSNSTGTVAATYTYDSFGNLAASSGAITNPFRYTSREFDVETASYNYRARYYDPSDGRFLSEDPIRFRAGANFYDYVGNSALNAIDPSGELVRAIYNKSSGQLMVTDLDTGKAATINVESGGKPFGDPIPNGTYDILEQQRKPDEFRLDKEDGTPYDDVDDATGRTHFRLHHPGRTIGCIAAKDWNGWNDVFNIISKTKTTMVPDNFKPWWKIWPSQPSYLRDFGTLLVQ